jgi:serine/threonine-protein kinase
MIGQTLSHYRIVEKIGAGGMGEVYKAHDERLDRDVAIKVLPSGTLVDDNARKRFRKEALALSKLNHPNIATVFDFDTQDGVDFIVMELVEGASLAEKVKTGPLPEKEISALGAQIADALEEAHEHGIVHRDLKPGNIAVTPKGRVKVLDFGLARMLRPASDEATTEALTQEQAVAGTLPYMSPEELRGERADHRSDLYSFGVVLYEMATGRRPFEEKLSTALTAAIVQKQPEPPTSHNRKVSPGLESIIIKALDKDPEHRYQSAREMRVDLERLSAPVQLVAPQQKRITVGRWLWAAASIAAVIAVLLALNVGGLLERLIGDPTQTRIDSIAVLPLDNLSGDPEQEYFADGMTDALIGHLAKIGALKVISRTSVMPYKGARKPLPEIARELSVAGVVEGSVLREGDRVRITVQLIEAATDQHLWTESYEREMTSILALQSEVARAIARKIEVAVSPEEEVRLANARSVAPEVHEAYLKGRYHWNQRTEDGMKRALEYFQQAINDDPEYAPAYVGLADSFNMIALYSYAPPIEVYPKAKAAALKALEIDDTIAEAHTSLAWAQTFEWDWLAAEGEFQRAIELNPSYAFGHQWYAGGYLAAAGRLDEAIAEFKRARELDPLSLIIGAAGGWVFYLDRQYDQAVEQFQKTLELDPNFWLTNWWLGPVYEQQGLFEEAIAAFRQAVANSGGSPITMASLGHAYAMAGRRDEAMKILGELNRLSKQRYVSSYRVAEIYVGLGDNDLALEWLQKAFEEHARFLVYLKVEPRLDPLRPDPRFQDLVRRMNFPE